MPNQRKAIRPVTWVLISGAGFVLFVALAIVFSAYSDRMNAISTPVYFFLLVTIALVAAGFLFGALRSHAKYSGTAYNGTLELSGPVVVLGIIILLGYKFRPAEGSFATTVNLFTSDSAHAAIDKGQLSIYYGTAHLTKAISDGQVVIHEMPKEFRGREATFIPAVEGYDSRAQKIIMPLSGGVVNLYLARIPDSVTVSGIVLAKGGKSVNHATLIFADGLGKTTSDHYGNFRLRLPFKDGAETNVRVYQKDVMKYNNLVRLSGQGPMTIQLN